MTRGEPLTWFCPLCGERAAGISALKSHMARAHPPGNYIQEDRDGTRHTGTWQRMAILVGAIADTHLDTDAERLRKSPRRMAALKWARSLSSGGAGARDKLLEGPAGDHRQVTYCTPVTCPRCGEAGAVIGYSGVRERECLACGGVAAC